MKRENKPFRVPAESNPADPLSNLVSIFERKGWLNQTLRIKHRERRYRICGSEKTFLAYRINESNSGSWGFPGWFACLVTEDHILEDSGIPMAESIEPSVNDWIRCIADDDFEIL